HVVWQARRSPYLLPRFPSAAPLTRRVGAPPAPEAPQSAGLLDIGTPWRALRSGVAEFPAIGSGVPPASQASSFAREFSEDTARRSRCRRAERGACWAGAHRDCKAVRSSLRERPLQRRDRQSKPS